MFENKTRWNVLVLFSRCLFYAKNALKKSDAVDDKGEHLQ